MSSSATANGTSERTENDLTIEQLAAQTGMSVRNIRAHQARGLLAPPEVRMRVGYYGPEHVAQLRQIRELQDEGFNLNGIKRLLEDQQGTAERLLHFKRSLAAPRLGSHAGPPAIQSSRASFSESAGAMHRLGRLFENIPSASASGDRSDRHGAKLRI